MIPGLAPNSLHQMTGFCTEAFHLCGKPLEKLEQLLGYRQGRLSAGATILFLETLPGPHDFLVSSYTYLSDGKVEGQTLSDEERDPYRIEPMLTSEMGWSHDDLRTYKQKMIGTKIVVASHLRLAKVVPSTPYSEVEQDAPSNRIFQVRLVRPLRFRVKATIAPGQTWPGDFA